ncbi:MAG: paraquat-inducible protein A, partial [Aquincola sp.]|nr:paraquat-inducible protein A [Aquincola sp.]
VALVKLGQLATLVVGPGLVALMAFMALRLAALRMLSPVDAWALLDPREVRLR